MRRVRPSAVSATWRSVGKSAGARIVTLPVAAVVGLLNTRLIIEHYGQHAYLQYGLLVGIAALLPFADLGISAAIMNATSEAADPAHDERLRRVLITSLRVLSGAIVVVLLVALLLTVGGAWPGLLGKGLIPGSGPLVAGLCLAVFGVNLAVSFGQRLLIGLDRAHVATLLLGLQTPVMLVAIVLAVALGLPVGNYLAVIAYGVLVGLGAVTLWWANRLVRPVIGRALRDARHLRTVRGGRVFDVGWPLLVQAVAVPLALQTDRIVLSHASTLHQLAIYTLASQLFTPVLGVISSAGAALWPIFARARARGSDDDVTSPNRLAFGFGAGAAVSCLLLSLVSPWLAARASDGSIHLPVSVLVAFSGLMVVQAVIYPLGSYLTDAPGLRFQALVILAMLPVNLVISYYLAGAIGATGPVLGSIISMAVCQFTGVYWYAQRERARRRNRAAAAASSAADSLADVAVDASPEPDVPAPPTPAEPAVAVPAAVADGRPLRTRPPVTRPVRRVPHAAAEPGTARPRYVPPPTSAPGWVLTGPRALAITAAFLLGLHVVVHGGVTIGDAVAPLTLALWVPNLRRFSWAWVVVVVGLAAVVWGWTMGSTAVLDGYALDSSWRLQTVAELASVVTGAAVLLWARTVVPTWVIGLFFGIGTVGNAVLYGQPSDNAWKFTWAVPVSLVVLSLAMGTGRRWAGPVALVALAVTSVVLDCRSYSAALALAFVLSLAVLRPGLRRPPTWAVATFVIALAGAVYYLGTSLLVSGYLGRAAQARSIAQIRTSGSLILGGRPEISATWALMKHRPGGYGAGVVPNGSDVLVAKQGLRGINYDPNNGYVEKYMFGGHIELHSNVGDLWAGFGIPGLVFIALVAVLMLRGIANAIARRSGTVLLLFTSVWTLWNVGFSPFESSSAVMTIALALALPQVRTRAATGGHGRDRSPRIAQSAQRAQDAQSAQRTKPAARRTPAVAASPRVPVASPAAR